MSRHVLDFEIPNNYVPDDDTMELLSALYSYMDEEEIKSWSLQAAEQLVLGQRRYEIEYGQEPKVYDPQDVYEVIRELIEQDAEDEDD